MASLPTPKGIDGMGHTTPSTGPDSVYEGDVCVRARARVCVCVCVDGSVPRLDSIYVSEFGIASVSLHENQCQSHRVFGGVAVAGCMYLHVLVVYWCTATPASHCCNLTILPWSLAEPSYAIAT